MLQAVFFATPLWLGALVIVAIPLILKPLAVRRLNPDARRCQALIAGAWFLGFGGGLLAFLIEWLVGRTDGPMMPGTFMRLCQGLPLMSLAVIGLALMALSRYPEPVKTAADITRADTAA